jgi:hypothetical protein
MKPSRIPALALVIATLPSLSLAIFPAIAFGDTIPYEISRDCKDPYENLERMWDRQGALQIATGVSDIMTPCEVDESLAAESILIEVDKAGLDMQTGGPTDESYLGLLRRRVYRGMGFKDRQRAYITVKYLNGKIQKMKFTVSTGNHLSDGADNPKETNMTPSGTFDLGRVNQGIDPSKHIKKSQAYCVQGAQYDYKGTPMPFAIFFKGGYAMHSGKVTGVPESHGCVRLDPHQAKNLYCLLRQKTRRPGTSAAEAAPVAEDSGSKKKSKKAAPAPVQMENYMVTTIKICDDREFGCDANGKPTKERQAEES